MTDTFDLENASEVVFGKILDGTLSANSIRSETLIEPYSSLLDLYKSGKKSPEELVEEFGISAYDSISTAIQAAHRTNTIPLGNKINWASILEKSYAYHLAGDVLEKEARKLKRGEAADTAKIKDTLLRADTSDGLKFVPLSSVELGAEMQLIPTGWKALDDHIGGLPEVGLVVIGGAQSSGKTSLGIKIGAKRVISQNKTVLVYSLEMITVELANRIRSIEKLTPEQEDLLLIYDQPITADEIISKSASVESLGLVIVDYADYLVKGEMNESAMSQIYKTLALGSKALHCPVILIAHTSRKPGLPKPDHLRWSSMAEATAWMVLMLYDPKTNFDEGIEDVLPSKPFGNKAPAQYILVWKIKGGFKKHLTECPGAIAIPFIGTLGWHDSISKWFKLEKPDKKEKTGDW